MGVDGRGLGSGYGACFCLRYALRRPAGCGRRSQRVPNSKRIFFPGVQRHALGPVPARSRPCRETEAQDAAVLAEFYATGFLREICTADGETWHCGVTSHAGGSGPVAHTAEDMIRTILHAHLVPPCPHVNIIGISGKRWLRLQVVSGNDRQAIER